MYTEREMSDGTPRRHTVHFEEIGQREDMWKAMVMWVRNKGASTGPEHRSPLYKPEVVGEKFNPDPSQLESDKDACLIGGHNMGLWRSSMRGEGVRTA